MTITVTSLRKIESGWNATRNTPNYRFEDCGDITPGLVKRLAAYAAQCLTGAGFGCALENASVEVMTDSGDVPQSERAYWVTFTTPKGGSVSVDYILTNKGWPVLDHGFSINRK